MQRRRLLIALSVVALCLLVIAGVILMSGGWPAGGGGQASPVDAFLTPANANSKTTLSAAQRQTAIDQCIAAFHANDDGGIVHLGKPEDVERELTRFSSESCTCLIDQLTKRTTTFQFVLGMAMEFAFAPRSDYAQFNGGSAKKRERLVPLAQGMGQSLAAFDEAGAKVGDAVMASGSACMDLHKN